MFPRILLIALLGLLPASADLIEVRALSFTSGEFPKCFVEGKDGFTPLAFSSIQPSEPVKAKASGFLPIYKQGPASEGELSYRVASRVKLPGDVDGILLLGMTSDDKTRFVAVKDDIRSARATDWVLINASSTPIAFQVGEKNKPMKIEAGETKLSRMNVKEGEGTSVLAHAPIGGKVKKILSTYWPVRPDRRTIVLFLQNGNKIKVKRIADKIGSGEEEEEE